MVHETQNKLNRILLQQWQITKNGMYGRQTFVNPEPRNRLDYPTITHVDITIPAIMFEDLNSNYKEY